MKVSNKTPPQPVKNTYKLRGLVFLLYKKLDIGFTLIPTIKTIDRLSCLCGHFELCVPSAQTGVVFLEPDPTSRCLIVCRTPDLHPDGQGSNSPLSVNHLCASLSPSNALVFSSSMGNHLIINISYNFTVKQPRYIFAFPPCLVNKQEPR